MIETGSRESGSRTYISVGVCDSFVSTRGAQGWNRAEPATAAKSDEVTAISSGGLEARIRGHQEDASETATLSLWLSPAKLGNAGLTFQSLKNYPDPLF